jgi:hypothetical protein
MPRPHRWPLPKFTPFNQNHSIHTHNITTDIPFLMLLPETRRLPKNLEMEMPFKDPTPLLNPMVLSEPLLIPLMMSMDSTLLSQDPPLKFKLLRPSTPSPLK